MAKKAIFKMAAASRHHLEFYKFHFLVTWLSSGSISAVVYKFHQNRTIFHWDNGDLTVLKMAAVRHLRFWKFAVYVMLPLWAWPSASYCKISQKSNNRLMSYGQKSDFQDGAILSFINFNFWPRDCHRVHYLLYCTIFYHNGTIFQWDIVI